MNNHGPDPVLGLVVDPVLCVLSHLELTTARSGISPILQMRILEFTQEVEEPVPAFPATRTMSVLIDI